MAIHPFDSITDAEFSLTAKLVKGAHPGHKIHFTQIDRLDPPKKDMIRFLDAERAGAPLPTIYRRTYAYYYLDSKMPVYKALVNVTLGHVITKTAVKDANSGPLLPEDIMEIEELCKTHPIVVAEAKKLKLPSHIQLCYEPWMYGTDSADVKEPMMQVYVYVKVDHPDANHYSLPVFFSPVFKLLTKEFVRMDYLPGGIDEKTVATQPWNEVPAVEYHPELTGEEVRDIKPLLLNQPEGTSFNIEGGKVTWQGWEFRVATNVREGVVLYDVWFKGRSLFYRISLNEMTVPYGDPRAPYHRKQAFDLGDCGFGANANQLNLGCDCLGVIKYLDCLRTDREGNPLKLTNTVCMHEQDYGILYKHMNFRNGNAVVTRRREFVVQTIATVGNYEYIVNFVLDQVGAITVQVRATGILSTMPIEEGKHVDWGTNIGPGVMAAYHQHLLSFRFDTRIDGDKNTVVYDDYHPMPRDPVLNKYGVGYVGKRTIVDKAGFVEQSPFTNRIYKVINEDSINKVTGKPVGYKFEMPAKQMMIASPDSWNVKRAAFATKQFWVTKYNDNQMYAAGEFTNQSLRDTGLGEWADGKTNVRNDDTVVWCTLALTHPPSTEQFPVMPSDFMQFLVSPSSFFEKNPALDVPLANNKVNKSKYYEETNGSSISSAEAKGTCCKTTL
ncbi:Copper amine oxidase 1 [Cyberlindnera fabianii]|uniref:Amine oxidase n=1 Tax=Cyberlindnera fabianii TaxID=36022 RepID=A0A1V2LB71_CYBFA|nr:Copper amine oxidase 1 [Cyberlindnera fabianii]